MTAGYDKKLHVWNTVNSQTPTLVKTLGGHEGKIMGFDVTPDDKTIVTVSYDRTFKLWSRDSLDF